VNDRGVFSLHGVLLDIGDARISDEIRQRIVLGTYEEEEVWSAPRTVESGDIVLDVGAGCGFISALVAKNCGPRRVIAVEADPDLIPVIKRTHDLNGTHADVFHEVLADADGETDFCVCEDFWVSSRRLSGGVGRPPGRTIRVPARSFSKRLEAWRPDCLLIDIEGDELELLTTPLPSFVRKVMIEVHEDSYGLTGVKRVMDTLAQSGFVYVPSASTGKVISYRRLTPSTGTCASA
jgi:FkbM family methyltransferase